MAVVEYHGKQYFQEWFSHHQAGCLFEIEKVLLQEKSPFQSIEVFQTPSLGCLFALDGIVQTIDRFEFIYHEMLAHPALSTHPNPQSALIIGGGDGGTLREVLAHRSVKEAVLCEIDEQVVKAAKNWLPNMSCSFGDPRASFYIGDGAAFVRETDRRFDIILIDSTDPTAGEGGHLFTEDFYRACLEKLTPQGILAAQTENPFYDAAWMKRAYDRISSVFPITRIYSSPCPQYPSGYWCYTIGSKEIDPAKTIPPTNIATTLRARYYSSTIHNASFHLPPFLDEMIHRPNAPHIN